MNSFARYREIVQQGLLELRSNIQPSSLQEQINYFLSLGGKRMRPSLLLAACDLYDGNLDPAVKPALGIELFHNFTLMHDDVMDEAPLRRNKETVHKKWNISTAILAGDAMYSSAFSLVTEVDNEILKPVISLFCETALMVCEGQQLDMLYEKENNVTVNDYLYMIEMKTAVLLACSLKTGALIGGAGTDDTEKLYQFGKNMGIAFQLQDDILDVYGNQEKFGKQIGGDIISGKKTFLLIKAIEEANDNEREFILKKKKTPDDINGIIEIYNKLNIKEKAMEIMEAKYNDAIQNLVELSVDKQKLDCLNEFTQSVMVREN